MLSGKSLNGLWVEKKYIMWFLRIFFYFYLLGWAIFVGICAVGIMSAAACFLYQHFVYFIFMRYPFTHCRYLIGVCMWLLASHVVYGQCQASFTVSPAVGCSGTAFRLDASASGPGNIASYRWKIAGVDMGAQTEPVYTYTPVIPSDASSEFVLQEVVLTIVTLTNEACSQTAQFKIVRRPFAPTFTLPTEACAGTPVGINYTPQHTSGSYTYTWDFGNGQTAFGATPTLPVYELGPTESSRVFQVRLTITNTHEGVNCTNTATRDIRIYKPRANFTFSPDSACAGTDISFDGRTSLIGKAPLRYDWDFGDGQISTSPNPTIRFTMPANGTAQDFMVRLTVTDALGCSDTKRTPVHVRALPTLAGINASAEEVCAGTAINFSARQAVGHDLTYQWDFGNGQSSTQPAPSYTYDDIGTGTAIHTVRLTITNSQGCSASQTRQIRVRRRPFIEIQNSNWIRCLPFSSIGSISTVLRHTSPQPSGIAEYRIDWGDNTPIQVIMGSSFGEVRHTYTAFGRYVIRVVAVGTNGCVSIFTGEQVIEVTDALARLISPEENRGCAPYRMRFINQSQRVSATTKFELDFGDGSPVLEYFAGQRGPISIAGTVSDTIEYIYNTNCIVNSGTIPNTLRATLRVVNSCTSISNNSNSFGPIRVFQKPIARFDAPQAICRGVPASFTNRSDLSYCSQNDTTRFVWIWGDGSRNDTVVYVRGRPRPQPPHGNISHRYDTTGLFNVRLIACNNNPEVSNCGCDEILQQVSVCTVPVARFTRNRLGTGCAPATVNYTSNAYGGAGNNCLAYAWTVSPATGVSFQNGTSASSASPQIVFASAGTYRVRAVVSNGCGTATFEEELVIKGLPSIELPTIADQCQNFKYLPRAVFGANGGTITSYQWTFSGVPAFSNLQQPDTVVFQTMGRQTVTVRATNECGTTTVSRTFELIPLPEAKLIRDTAICLGASVSLGFAAVPGNTYSFSPTVGLNNPISSNPTANPAQTTVYTLTETNTATGCRRSRTVRVTVLPLPVPDFTAIPQAVCVEGDSIAFQGSANVPINTWQWSFGDGVGSASQQFARYRYRAPGTYEVRLTVGDMSGCRQSVVKTVTVRPLPLADFVIQDTCLGDATLFVDRSVSTNGDIRAWSWDFGGGNTATQAQVRYTFPAVGTYPVSLTVTDASGCSRRVTKSVVIRPSPTANFGVQAVCVGQPTVFSDLSVPAIGQAIRSWAWQFGDPAGSSSTAQHPTHTYAAAGTYIVSLTIEDQAGCRHSITREVTVRPRPTADFSATTVCPGTATRFTDQSVAAGAALTGWSWQFGDGRISTAQHPVHTYAAAGTYEVVLTVTDQQNCTNSIRRTVRVHTPPTADFEVNAVQLGSQTVFTDVSTATVGTSLSTWFWQLGDGTTSSVRSPVHTYAAPGSYPVVLIVTDQNGCRDTTIRIAVVNPLPQADFSADPVCLGRPTAFQDLSVSGGGNIVGWSWNFGDGTGTSTDRNPVYTYALPGIYQVTLTIRDQRGSTAVATRSVVVYRPPQANFDFGIVCAGEATRFTDMSTGFISPVVSWQWDFGDGSGSASVASPVYTFGGAGTYVVRLRVTDANGCRHEITKPVLVRQLPTARFVYSRTCVGNQTSFSDISTGGNGSRIVSWRWDLGDGSTVITTQNPQHLYAAAGVYQVRLTVTDQNNCTHSIVQPVEVRSLPVPAMTVSPNTCLGEQTRFVGTSDRPVALWSWNFGDNSGVSNLASPSHVYTAPGVYEVILTVTDTSGCMNAVAGTITVRPLPVVDFTASTACMGAPTQFGDLSVSQPGGASPNQWHWDFGDGQTSQARHPLHLYAAAGTYNVTLTVTDQAQCRQRITKSVVVRPAPLPDFGVSGTCFGELTMFSDLSRSLTPGVPLNGWQWDLGDGTTSGLQHPQHTYNAAGDYQVRLRVTDAAGCQATLLRTVHIHTLPQANFEAATVCLGDTTRFVDRSTSTGGNVVGWNWDFGDGAGVSTSASPVYRYQQPGVYVVRLRVTDTNGCRADIVRNVQVLALPAFGFAASAACAGDPVQFTYEPVAITGTAVSWQWDFGDGQSSAAINPVHQYAAAGSYAVSLTVRTSDGCRRTVTRPVQINPLPLAAFQAAPVCQGFPTTFVNQSVGVSGPLVSHAWDFGDGNLSNDFSPIHRYDTAGNYTVRLTVQNTAGCRAVVERTVVVYPLPAANFGVSAACLGDTTFFTDLSFSPTAAIQSWQWDFGDANGVSLVRNPFYVYTAAGTYQVRLRITDANGCTHVFGKAVQVRPRPTAAFSAPQVCAGQPTTFVNQSLPAASPLVGYWWDFGDGRQSTAFSPQHLYAQPGTYQVTLVVTDQAGCRARQVQPVVIVPRPVADFEANEACLGDFTQLSDRSRPAVGNLVFWSWDMGDGTFYATPNPRHRYAAAGTYAVRLIVRDQNGCRDTTEQPVRVLLNPIADFRANTTCVDSLVNFEDLSVGISAAIQRWQWDFGDGIGRSNAQHPRYRYASAGDKIVTLVVTNAAGCEDTIRKNILVKPLPTVEFSAGTVCLGEATRFEDRSSGGTMVSWSWDFGDGVGRSTLQHPAYTYGTHGQYQVRLTVRDISGCTNSVIREILVNPRPIPRFGADTTCIGLQTRFTDQSFSPGGNIVSWQWDFGDGTSATIQNPVHTYSQIGAYAVKLLVGDARGCRDSVVQTVFVKPLPQVAFEMSSGRCVGQPIQFEDRSTATLAAVTAWQWDFGDGVGTAFTARPVYAYPRAGTYTVRLEVTDATGCKNTLSRPITIDSLPLAAFEAPAVCFGDTTVFFNRSAGQPDNLYTWFWEFGDGQTSTQASPRHLYARADTFEVRLRIQDINGCSRVTTKQVVVHHLPVADFVRDTACIGQSMQIRNLSYSIGSPIVQTRWDFGDQTTFSGSNPPPHTYQQPGTYDIRLWVRTAAGCQDSIVRRVIVYPRPQTDFRAAQACFGSQTRFTDLTTAAHPVAGWLWDFGDNGQTSLQQHPTYIFSRPGIFQVSLTVRDINGCQTTLVKPVSVDTLPRANFSTSDACLGQDIQFTDLSRGYSANVIGWQWSFGDDRGQSTLQNPVYRYAQAGTYTVRLRVTDLNGCTDTVSRAITVHPNPVAAFLADTVCQGLPLHFQNLSYNTAGPLTQYRWDLGDGTISTLWEPVHTYATADTFQVKLIVANGFGCSDTVSRAVIVRPLPEAWFVAERVCAGEATRFRDETTFLGGRPVQWNWDFADGQFSTLQNPVHQYATAGTYAVRLTVTDEYGCTDLVVRQVIADTLPRADFRANPVYCLGERTQFEDLSIGFSGNIVLWEWSFGDGNTSALSAPAHTYTLPGHYTVRLRVQDDKGCSDTVQKSLQVLPRPRTDFRLLSGCAGQTAQFEDLSYSPGDSTVYWSWNFGDGTGVSSVQHPGYTYASPGIYQVTLITANRLDCRDTLTKAIVIRARPVADFEADTVCLGQPTRFRDLSAAVAGAGLSRWTWHFGDNVGTSQQQHPQYLYNSAGTFEVSLTVTDSAGCISTVRKPVWVKPLPIADFTYRTVCFGDSVPFEDLSAGATGLETDIIGWQWDFGGGQTSALQHPRHLFGAPGTYPVSLTVTDMRGCRRTVTLPVQVNPLPQPDFEATGSCIGHPMQFLDRSVAAGDTVRAWLWQFGDGQSAGGYNPSHIYTRAGTYTVTLTVVTAKNCRRSIQKNVTVHPQPDARMMVNQVCQQFPTTFTDQSVANGGIISAWIWHFGDGSPADTRQNPTHVYQQAGQYTVRLIVTNSQGCRDTTSQEVIVKPLPTADFVVRNTCIGETAIFTSTSLGNGVAILYYVWDMGDNSPLYATPVVRHRYRQPGTYTVRLTVVDLNGCRAQVTKNVVIHPLPLPSFQVRPGRFCVENPVQFANTSTGATSYLWLFGDGFSSNAPNPSHVYTRGGTYTVRLIARSAAGCTDLISRSIEVTDIARARFQKSTAAGCAPLRVQFLNQTQMTNVTGAVSYRWDFGNGQTSTAIQPPAVNYRQSLLGDTTYYVTLTVTTDTCGATAYRDSVLVRPRPVPRFDFSLDRQCSPVTVTFRNQTTGLPVSYLWRFGDGHVSTQAEPVHTYRVTDTTTFTVTLIARNACGADSIRRQFTIYPNTVRAFLSASTTQGCAPLDVQFNNFTQGTPFVLWDFGDGQTANVQHPRHTYARGGTYQVQLFATDGCSFDTARLQIRVWPQADVRFRVEKENGTVADTVCVGEAVRCSNLTSGLTGLLWEFGDGNSSTMSAPVHRYAQPGIYTIRLNGRTISDGCQSSQSRQIVVLPSPVVGFQIGSQTGCQPYLVRFQNTTTLANSYRWDFGDGTPVSTQADPVHLYTRPGLFVVRLTATNPNGCSREWSREIRVHPAPESGFTTSLSAHCGAPVTVRLTNTSQGAAGYFWNFGNGQTSTLTHPQVVYRDTGTYVIRLIAVSILGCPDTSVQTVRVFPVSKANFSLLSPSGRMEACASDSLEIRTRNQSVFADQFEWDFGDGFVSTAREPVHRYTRPGTYRIRLTVRGNGICTDTMSQGTVIIHPNPRASFSYQNVAEDPMRGTVRFVNTSTGADTARTIWSFGDGTTVVGGSPVHRYELPGLYRVRMAVISAFGCRDTVSREVEVSYFKGLFIPNALSPDKGIGESKVFLPKGVGLESYRIQVFDKWGALIWESERLENGMPAESWDGTRQGVPVPAGAYVWRCEARFQDGTTWKGDPLSGGRVGTVTVIR